MDAKALHFDQPYIADRKGKRKQNDRYIGNDQKPFSAVYGLQRQIGKADLKVFKTPKRIIKHDNDKRTSKNRITPPIKTIK